MNLDQTAASDRQGAFTFHGEFERSVDKKGRFNLPFRFRQAGQGSADEKYVVIGGVDGSLALLPHAVFTAKINRMHETGGSESRQNIRKISRSSTMVEPDSQGRVAVSPAILTKAGITGKITVVGMVTHMELWDPDTLQKVDAGGEGPDAGFLDDFLG